MTTEPTREQIDQAKKRHEKVMLYAMQVSDEPIEQVGAALVAAALILQRHVGTANATEALLKMIQPTMDAWDDAAREFGLSRPPYRNFGRAKR